MMLRLYQAIMFVASPFMVILGLSRIHKELEDKSRFSERLGIPSLPRPLGKVIWVHAASVGEALSAMSMLSFILKNNTSVSGLITTGTVSSAKLVRMRIQEDAKLSSRCIHQYITYDNPIWVKRFIKHWMPSVAIFVESELWPNLISEIKKRKIPLILINARLSYKSSYRWSFIPKVFKQLISKFDLILAQSDEDTLRFRNFWPEGPILAFGNIKYASPLLPVNDDALSQFKNACTGRKVFVAASTHQSEEEIVLEAVHQLKNSFPNLLTIIVPRHPARTPDIIRLLYGFQTQRRSESTLPDKKTDFYIADTFGELGLFYRIADIVFVGGSLVPSGGHNLIEAAQLGCAVIHGPHMHNFREMRERFRKYKASIEVRSGESLAKAVEVLLKDDEKREALKKSSLQLAEDSKKILESLESHVKKYIA